VEIRFTKAARKHRIGRASVRNAMASTAPTPTTTDQGNVAWLYVGLDERNRELEIIAVEVEREADHEAFLLVIHAMPTKLKKR
jgi:hypothetical protein